MSRTCRSTAACTGISFSDAECLHGAEEESHLVKEDEETEGVMFSECNDDGVRRVDCNI